MNMAPEFDPQPFYMAACQSLYAMRRNPHDHLTVLDPATGLQKGVPAWHLEAWELFCTRVRVTALMEHGLTP